MRACKKRALAVAISLGAGLSGMPALLQAEEAESQEGELFALEEIVVTAQRREQSLQDVPIAVSAVDTDTLKQNGLTGLQDLGSIVSGVKLGNSQASESVSSIRGIRSRGFGFGLEESVPIYLDGVYLGSGYNTLGELMDVTQIEVLKGPQGTLFGRNASAGAINIRSARPNEELSGKVSMNLGNYDLVITKLSGNIPVIEDTLMIRAGYQQTQRDGWQTNVVSVEKDGYETDRWSGYVKGLWLASDDLEVEFSADWSRHDDHSGYVSVEGVNTTFENVYNTFVDSASYTSSSSHDFAAGGDPITSTLALITNGLVPDSTPRSIGVADAVDPERSRKIRGASVKVTWDVSEEATLTSVSSYRKSSSSLATDSDGSNLGMSASFTDTSYEEMNQEFRFNISNDVADWFVGFNAYRQNTNYSFVNESSGLVAASRLTRHILLGGGGGTGVLVATIANPISEESAGKNTTTSYGLYSDVIWHLTDRMNITVGARYSYDEKVYEQGVTANDSWSGQGILFPNLAQLENAADAKMDESWSNLSGRIALDYALNEDALVYVSLAQGYKAGGFNTTRTVQQTTSTSGVFVMPGSAAEPFDEETNLNFEVGLKSTLMDGRMRFNTSAFAYEYKDLQFLLSDSEVPVARTINASKVDGYGVDVEMMFAATEDLTLSMNLAYLQSEFGEDVVDRNGDLVIENGAETTFSPEVSGSIGVDYRHALGDLGELRTNLTYSYYGTHMQRDIQVGDNFPDGVGKEDAYQTFNGRISLLSHDGMWEVAIWGKNLTDEYYNAMLSTGAGVTAGIVASVPSEPRTYGVNLEYNF